MSDTQKQNPSESGKARKQYEKDLAMLTQVLGGEFLFQPSMLVPDEVKAAVKELAKKQKEKLIKEFQDDAAAAIEKQREHIAHVAVLKKKFQTEEEASMKDFSKTVSGLFKRLKDIKNIEKDYFDILMGKTGGEEQEDPIAEEDTTTTSDGTEETDKE